MRIRFEEILKAPRSEPMPETVNGAIRKALPAAMVADGVGVLFDKVESHRWFGKLKYPASNPKYEFTFRFGVCQCFTTLFIDGNASFQMNTNNESVDFGGKKHERN